MTSAWLGAHSASQVEAISPGNQAPDITRASSRDSQMIHGPLATLASLRCPAGSSAGWPSPARPTGTPVGCATDPNDRDVGQLVVVGRLRRATYASCAQRGRERERTRAMRLAGTAAPELPLMAATFLSTRGGQGCKPLFSGITRTS